MRTSRSPARTAVMLAALATLTPGHPTEAGASPTTRLEAGRLLVARRGMADPNFSRTVVLLLSHGDDGALGVVVNRPSRIPLSRLLPEVAPLAGRTEPVFRGGPVAVDRLIFTLRTAAPPAGCLPVLADVCASGSVELLEKTLGREEAAVEFRGFAGYAGWAPGQLEWEIEQSSWYVLPGDSESVFDRPPEELWSDLVRRAEAPVA